MWMVIGRKPSVMVRCGLTAMRSVKRGVVTLNQYKSPATTKGKIEPRLNTVPQNKSGEPRTRRCIS